jgi:hypothetical protein
MFVESRATGVTRRFEMERQHPRYFLSAPVIVCRTINLEPLETHGLTVEISLGGLSAVLCGPPEVGEQVLLKLQLLGGAFETAAIVRHSSTARTGFQFLGVPPDFPAKLETCIQCSLVWPWPREISFPRV